MEEMKDNEHPYASRYIDLLDERLGGKALACSDEWFAECAKLGGHADLICKQGHFVPTGQWMDGWESRRSWGRSHRQGEENDDWCVL